MDKSKYENATADVTAAIAEIQKKHDNFTFIFIGQFSEITEAAVNIHAVGMASDFVQMFFKTFQQSPKLLAAAEKAIDFAEIPEGLFDILIATIRRERSDKPPAGSAEEKKPEDTGGLQS